MLYKKKTTFWARKTVLDGIPCQRRLVLQLRLNIGLEPALSPLYLPPVPILVISFIVFSHHQAFSFQTDLKSLLSLFPTFKYHLNSQEMYNKGEVLCNLVEVKKISVGEFIELICKIEIIFVFPFDLTFLMDALMHMK